VTYDGVAARVRQGSEEHHGRRRQWPARNHSQEQRDLRALVERARNAIAYRRYDGHVDRLCRAVAGRRQQRTATALANMSVDESGMGSREPKRRAKFWASCATHRQKSMGIIEEIPEKGIVKVCQACGHHHGARPVPSP
jgi:sulfoacetaldehyde dehydrogenase